MLSILVLVKSLNKNILLNFLLKYVLKCTPMTSLSWATKSEERVMTRVSREEKTNIIEQFRLNYY